MTSKELKKANENIQDFLDKFDAVLTITNAKGKWTGRVTRHSVQVILTTGDSLVECIMHVDQYVNIKRQLLGV